MAPAPGLPVGLCGAVVAEGLGLLCCAEGLRGGSKDLSAAGLRQRPWDPPAEMTGMLNMGR